MIESFAAFPFFSVYHITAGGVNECGGGPEPFSEAGAPDGAGLRVFPALPAPSGSRVGGGGPVFEIRQIYTIDMPAIPVS